MTRLKKSQRKKNHEILCSKSIRRFKTNKQTKKRDRYGTKHWRKTFVYLVFSYQVSLDVLFSFVAVAVLGKSSGTGPCSPTRLFYLYILLPSPPPSSRFQFSLSTAPTFLTDSFKSQMDKATHWVGMTSLPPLGFYATDCTLEFEDLWVTF